jgi:hypothetical protein
VPGADLLQSPVNNDGETNRRMLQRLAQALLEAFPPSLADSSNGHTRPTAVEAEWPELATVAGKAHNQHAQTNHA